MSRDEKFRPLYETGRQERAQWRSEGTPTVPESRREGVGGGGRRCARALVIKFLVRTLGKALAPLCYPHWAAAKSIMLFVTIGPQSQRDGVGGGGRRCAKALVNKFLVRTWGEALAPLCYPPLGGGEKHWAQYPHTKKIGGESLILPCAFRRIISPLFPEIYPPNLKSS